MAELENFPTVSVILTSYNHASYVAAAIESVLNQTFADFELLIIDDGSTDDSREIIKGFSDSRIKLFLYEENRGPVIAIREAVNSARGKYIAVHHSDDLWTPEKLARQVAFLDANPNYAACFTRVEFVDECGNIRSLEHGDSYENVFDQPNRSRAKWLNYFFYNANCLCHPSAMLRREVYEKFHLLEVHGFWQLPDYLMWIRLCFHAEIFILPERLTLFRLRRARQENTSATTFDRLVRADTEFFFIAREFVYNFTDNKFFLDVFPEAQRFVVNGQINRRFAFAQICLEKTSSAFQLVGLDLLKELLNSPANAAEIKTLYDYDEKSFLRDTGAYDVFNLAQKLETLRAEIFTSNGEEFSLVATKIISVESSKKFYGRIDFDLSRPVNYLRFDPDTNFISVKLNRVLINGAAVRTFRSNAATIVNGFCRFWTNDPQFVFDVKNLSGHVTLEVFGELEKDYPAILEQTLKNFVVRDRQLSGRNEKLRAKNDDLQRHSESLDAQNANLHAENQRLLQFSESLLNSNSWKLTEPLRAFRQWLGYGGRDKALAAGRLLYKALPFDEDKKIELKNKFYTQFAPLLKGTQRYRDWQFSQGQATRPPLPPPSDEKFFGEELAEQPGKIAIQAHIFYPDLLDEMASYCANMPYAFDALISVVDKNLQDKALAAFEKIPTAEKVIVRIVPNRGRDVAPLLAGFGDLMPEYDFFAHIHSKKSLYTGSEQQNWRKYLFDALLGSPARIRKIFRAFVDNAKVGVIYPRPADNVPYAAFTWMSNRAVGMHLLERAGIAPNKTEYFDFPAGTMFWARTQALRKIFALNLKFDDFPPEQSQNDGTIAHAFERSILLAAQAEGMSYYEFEPANESYSVNCGNKNLWQYFGRAAEEFQSYVINRPGVLSFDVFDTLLMRYVAQPRHVNEIIRLRVEDLLGRDIDFPTLRVEAEKLARDKKGGDVTLDEIYQNFAELTGLPAATCNRIRELEIATEEKLILPRPEVVEWFHNARRYGKEIWLITDMYMQTPNLTRLLKKCGVEGYAKLLISCETGLRKDTAAIWNRLMEENLNSPDRLMHVGDNETSDIQLPADRKFGAYHIMSAINLFSQVPFGRALLEELGNMSLYAGICLGVVLAKKFHDPFRLRASVTDGTNRLLLKSFHELGYWLYGAPLLTFMLWLIQRTRADDIERILFFARDGYFLMPLYQFVAELLHVKALPSDYFLASRRAVTIAAIRELEQAKDLIKLRFEGTEREFFQARFGLELGGNEEIYLPNDSVLFPNNSEQTVEKIIADNAKHILRHAEDERNNYEKYIASLGGSFDRVGVVDMGYSGTIQYYLQELTGKTFTGYYFATSATNRFGEAAGERMRGCFAENDDYQWTKSAVYRYQLLFEAILTAPDAQLKHFDAAGNPVFGDPEPGQRYFKEISEIHEGIKDFCRDAAEIFGDILLRVDVDKNFVDSWVKAFITDKIIVAPRLREIFTLDDEYCNTFHGNALDFYLRGLERQTDGAGV